MQNNEEKALKEEMYAYATHMLTNSNREDVFDAVVELLRNFTTVDDVRTAFYKLRTDARKAVSFHKDPVMRAYDKEATRGRDRVYDAYVKELKKR